MQLRLIGLMMAAALSVGCSRGEWKDLRIDGEATVDGQLVKSNTLWRIRTTDAFPQGARIEMSGVALAIPVAPDHYVYGLVRGRIQDRTFSWDVLLSGLNAFVGSEDKRADRRSESARSFSAFNDYTAERMKGRRLRICVEGGFPGQDRCPIFVFFENPSDPLSMKFIEPGQPVTIAGRRVVITQITSTYQDVGGTSLSTLQNLPKFVRENDDAVFAPFPKHFSNNDNASVKIRDFRRVQ